jgi:hypothetical protein
MGLHECVFRVQSLLGTQHLSCPFPSLESFRVSGIELDLINLNCLDVRGNNIYRGHRQNRE